MQKRNALIGSFVFFVIAPGTLAGLLPFAITNWKFRPPFFGEPGIRWLGAAFVVLGLTPLVDSFRRFALEGFGTPAPIAPPRLLVTGGFYRFVRNPMYFGVVTVILGQAFLLGDDRLLWMSLILWLGFHLFVVGYEEPILLHTFGGAYEKFLAHVPRWIPRLTPWRGEWPSQD